MWDYTMDADELFLKRIEFIIEFFLDVFTIMWLEVR